MVFVLLNFATVLTIVASHGMEEEGGLVQYSSLDQQSMEVGTQARALGEVQILLKSLEAVGLLRSSQFEQGLSNVSSSDPVTADSVIANLKSLILPALDQAHSSDQALLDAAEQALLTCQTDRTGEDSGTADLHTNFTDVMDTHKSCRETEKTKEVDENTKCGDATRYYNTLTGIPSCTKPSAESAMMGFLEDNKDWYTSTLATWNQKDGACTTATAANTQQAMACNDDQAQMESDFCSWYHAQWVQWHTYEACWSVANSATAGYPAVKKAVLAREASRQHSFKLFQEIECLIRDVLMSNTSVTSQTALAASAAACHTTPAITVTRALTADELATASCTIFKGKVSVDNRHPGKWMIKDFSQLASESRTTFVCDITASEEFTAVSASYELFHEGASHNGPDDDEAMTAWGADPAGKDAGYFSFGTPTTIVGAGGTNGPDLGQKGGKVKLTFAEGPVAATNVVRFGFSQSSPSETFSINNFQMTIKHAYAIIYDAPTAVETHNYDLAVPGENVWAQQYFADLDAATHHAPNPVSLVCQKGKHATTSTPR